MINPPMDYRFVGPDGTEYCGSNLRQFCREHGLDSGNMTQVYYGSRRHHKGFTCPDSGYYPLKRGRKCK